MLLTISLEADVFQTEVAPGDTVGTLQANLEGISGIAAGDQLLIHNGRPLQSSATLSASGVQDQDLLVLTRRQAAVQPSSGAVPPPPEQWNERDFRIGPDGALLHPQEFMKFARSHPHVVRSSFPPHLVEAANQGDIETLQRVFRQIDAHKRATERERQAEMELLSADPFDVEAQAKIAERIRQQQVEENYQAAYEHMPEVFSQVTMLYVDMEVNGVQFKAFVDSGAQTSIMSEAAADRCNIKRLLDTRFAGIARGVGSAPIVGRVHSVSVKVGTTYLPMSITVMEKGPEFLFGLDMLRRYQCNIDLKANVLRFAVEPEVALPFLAEHELPESVRFEMQGEAEAGPSGSTPASQPGSAAKMSPSATAAAGAAAAARAASAPGQTVVPRAPATAPAPAAAAASSAAPPAAENEEKVQRLVALGFPRQQCLEVLAACNGNEEHAASLLFEMTGGLGF
ncbi:g2324 [Coccomyxa elongata]